MTTGSLFPLEYKGKIIDCQSADDRKLLQAAILLDGHQSDCDQYPSAELTQMSKICEQYGLSAREYRKQALKGLSYYQH